MPRTSKKSLILAYLARTQPAMLDATEAAAIRRELRRELADELADNLADKLADKGTISDRYLRDIAEGAGVPVSAAMGGIPLDLLDILKFDTLSGAEAAIAHLDRLRSTQPDTVKLAARRAANDAEWIARNPRVRQRVRQEHAEIAQWFRIWLETPDIFPAWLHLRRQAPEFVASFLL